MMGWPRCVCKVFSSYPRQIQWKRVFKTRNGCECVSPVSPHLAQSNVLVKVSGFLNVIEWEIWDKLTAADSWFREDHSAAVGKKDVRSKVWKQ